MEKYILVCQDHFSGLYDTKWLNGSSGIRLLFIILPQPLQLVLKSPSLGVITCEVTLRSYPREDKRNQLITTDISQTARIDSFVPQKIAGIPSRIFLQIINTNRIRGFLF